MEEAFWQEVRALLRRVIRLEQAFARILGEPRSPAELDDDAGGISDAD